MTRLETSVCLIYRLALWRLGWQLINKHSLREHAQLMYQKKQESFSFSVKIRLKIIFSEDTFENNVSKLASNTSIKIKQKQIQCKTTKKYTRSKNEHLATKVRSSKGSNEHG